MVVIVEIVEIVLMRVYIDYTYPHDLNVLNLLNALNQLFDRILKFLAVGIQGFSH